MLTCTPEARGLVRNAGTQAPPPQGLPLTGMLFQRPQVCEALLYGRSALSWSRARTPEQEAWVWILAQPLCDLGQVT